MKRKETKNEKKKSTMKTKKREHRREDICDL